MSNDKDLEKEKEEIVCAFCGRNKSEADQGTMFINAQGSQIFICSSCVKQAMDVIDQEQILLERAEAANMEDVVKTITPSKIRQFLDQYIIGQDRAKEVLSVAVYNHYKFLKYWQQENPEVELQKSNILMLGPTGVGKTEIIKQLAKILKVPYAIADSSQMTAAGYVGADVESCVRSLIDNANGDVKLAERGIIYLDEFDKLTRKSENTSITRDVGGEGVQQALLKLIEGCEISVPPKGQRKHPDQVYDVIDTSKVLFIVGGSFEGIEKIIEKRLNKTKASMGFVGQVISKDVGETVESFNDLIYKVQVEDLKKFGMIPEVLGRLPVICPLEQLDVEKLVRILKEPKNAIIKQYQALIGQDGVDIEFTEDAISEIANIASKRKTGARSLRGIMEDILLPYMYQLPDQKDVIKMTITKDCVLGTGKPQFEYAPAEMA